MARAIDYGLNVRQAAINNYMNAVANRAQKKAEADARAEKAARQRRKGLMTLALHAGAAVATGGASLPYSAKYGAFANKALMGDDYEGSGVDALQGLGSAVYSGAEQAKAKQLAGMEKSYNNQLEGIYARIDALPQSQVMERARLANQAANLTNTYEDQLDAMNKKPSHEFLGSEREKMTMRIPTASGSATPAQISTGTKVEEVAEASGKDVKAPDAGFEKMTPGDYKMIEEAYQQTDAPFYDAGQMEEMKRARMETPSLGRESGSGIMNTTPQSLESYQQVQDRIKSYQDKYRTQTEDQVRKLMNQRYGYRI